MKTKVISLVFVALLPLGGRASEDDNLVETCKAECPSAKTEAETLKCVAGKKNDKKFRKSDCFAASRDHEKHEKDGNHNH